MAIQGLRTTGNFAADERPKNWREGYLLKYPNGKAPLTALTSQMRSRSTNDPEFNFWEKSFQTRRLTLGADLVSTDTTVTVTEGAFGLKAGDVIYVEKSGELMLVAQDPIVDTSFAVTRQLAGTTAEATVAYASENPWLVVAGSAYEEASPAPTGVNFDPSKITNYTQIFRNTLEMSNTALKTRLRTKEQVAEAKREVSELHMVDMERAFLLGKKSEGTKNGKPFRTTDGVIARIASGNIVANNGTALTMTALEGYLERIFRKGSSEKMVFAGNLALLAIQQAIRKSSSFNIQAGIKEYGMNVTRLTCPFGELVIKTHPLFNALPGDTSYVSFNSWFLVLDFDYIKYVYLEGRDTKYEQNLQENGLDGMKSGYITEAGLEVGFDEAHFLITGLKAGTVDS